MCVDCSEINYFTGERIADSEIQSRVSLRANNHNVACVTCTLIRGVSDAKRGWGKENAISRRAQPPVADVLRRGLK